MFDEHQPTPCEAEDYLLLEGLNECLGLPEIMQTTALTQEMCNGSCPTLWMSLKAQRGTVDRHMLQLLVPGGGG